MDQAKSCEENRLTIYHLMYSVVPAEYALVELHCGDCMDGIPTTVYAGYYPELTFEQEVIKYISVIKNITLNLSEVNNASFLVDIKSAHKVYDAMIKINDSCWLSSYREEIAYDSMNLAQDFYGIAGLQGNYSIHMNKKSFLENIYNFWHHDIEVIKQIAHSVNTILEHEGVLNCYYGNTSQVGPGDIF